MQDDRLDSVVVNNETATTAAAFIYYDSSWETEDSGLFCCPLPRLSICQTDPVSKMDQATNVIPKI